MLEGGSIVRLFQESFRKIVLDVGVRAVCLLDVNL